MPHRRDPDSPTKFYHPLRVNEEFRLLFADHLQRHLFADGILTPQAAEARWLDASTTIEAALFCESARWGDYRRGSPYRPDSDWVAAQEELLDDYFPRRAGILLDQFRAQGMYPEIDPPRLSRQGGPIEGGTTIGLSSHLGTSYYTLDGSDPRLPGGEVSPVARSAGIGSESVLLTAPYEVKFFVPVDGRFDGVWAESGFDDQAWTMGLVGVGYETNTGFESEIETDLESEMHDTNASVYLRLRFDVEDPDDLAALILRMKYDDGYVAYLNGVEVARRNAPDDLVWNARAEGSHADALALEFEAIDITERLSLLRPGENVLGIHGLNAVDSSSDFLIVPELRAGELGDSGVVLDETAKVRARARLGEEWSAIVEERYFLDEPTLLRVTEIMYHPPSPLAGSSYSDDDFEFLEVQNVGAERIVLLGLRFREAVEFEFEGTEALESGEVAVLVRNLTAFRERYGEVPRVLGEYEGRLDNVGDLIVVEDALGNTIHDFEFSDQWYSSTDGRGRSLEIRDATASVDSWSQAGGWRESPDVLGSPGGHADPLPGGTVLAGDANHDGSFDLSDPIRLLRVLFAGAEGLPCDGDLSSEANRFVLDVNGDGAVNLSDAIFSLEFLFRGGSPPVEGDDCRRFEFCSSACP
ncbi:MAG: hypothetical protein AAF517_03870 [Planctomycetota bacterium]